MPACLLEQQGKEIIQADSLKYLVYLIVIDGEAYLTKSSVHLICKTERLTDYST